MTKKIVTLFLFFSIMALPLQASFTDKIPEPSKNEFMEEVEERCEQKSSWFSYILHGFARNIIAPFIILLLDDQISSHLEIDDDGNGKIIATASVSLLIYSFLEVLFQDKSQGVKKVALNSLKVGLKDSEYWLANLVTLGTKNMEHGREKIIVHEGSRFAIYALIEHLAQKEKHIPTSLLTAGKNMIQHEIYYGIPSLFSQSFKAKYPDIGIVELLKGNSDIDSHALLDEIKKRAKKDPTIVGQRLHEVLKKIQQELNDKED